MAGVRGHRDRRNKAATTPSKILDMESCISAAAMAVVINNVTYSLGKNARKYLLANSGGSVLKTTGAMTDEKKIIIPVLAAINN